MKKLLPIIIALLISNSVFGQLPTTNLLAWYPFCDGSIADLSGNGYSLNYTAGPTPSNTADRFTNPATALLYGGASSLFYPVPFLSASAFASSDFSYSCWIYPLTVQSSIIWFNGDPQTDGYGLYMNNGTLGTAGTNVEVVFGGAIGQFASTAVTLNAWHHLLLVKNGNAYEFYIDGTPIPFVGLPAFVTPAGAGDQFTVGGDYTSITDASSFNGKIDDIAIYSIQLSSAQISALNTLDPDVAPFTLGNLAADTTVCADSIMLASSIAFDPAIYTFAWNTGAITDTVTVGPPGSPGAGYTLTVSELYGCSASASVNVQHLNVTVHIGPRDTTFCISGSATLNPSPVAGETYLWNTGATTGSISVTAAGTYWVAVDSADGCTGVDTETVKIQDTVIVNIGHDTSSCDGSPIVLTSILDSGAVSGLGTKYTWGWDIVSPPLGGVTTNQTYTVTTSGTYWVADTVGKCFGVDTVTIGIVYDSLTILNRRDTFICKNGTAGSVQIRGFGNPSASYLWTPTAGVASPLSVNPLIVPDTSSWYKVTATLFGCVKADSIYIDVQPQPSVYIGGNRNVCKGDTIHITATVSPSWYSHYIYSWSPGSNLSDSATTVGDSVVSTVVFTAGDSTDLIIIVKTPLDSTGRPCRSVDSAEIMVHTPRATLLTDTAICPGDSVTLNPNPVAGDSYAWHSGIYLSDSDAVQPIAKPITTIFYWVQSTDIFGCHDTVTENITVHPGAVIDLGDSVVLYPGQTYKISPQTNCVYFAWHPPLGLSDTSIGNPVASPVVNTKYIVNATTEWGCSTTDSINIDVDPASIVAVPNAFTPGESVNNYLFVLKRGVAILNYFRIFNRWGNVVYESNNIDAGWDGTFHGQPQPFDVYVYDLQAVTNEGIIFQKTGNITLIR